VCAAAVFFVFQLWLYGLRHCVLFLNVDSLVCAVCFSIVSLFFVPLTLPFGLELPGLNHCRLFLNCVWVVCATAAFFC
jgi:hypothetical protein